MEERLRKFAHLVDIGSFTKAAQELHISQPALTAAINKLERELHGTLLVRNTRSLQLTAAGEIAYASAKELMVSTENLKTRLADLSHIQPSIAIGMIDSVASTLFSLDSSVDELEKQAKVSLVVDNSRNLLRALARDELDAAFVVSSTNIRPATISLRHIATEPLVAVCHASDATAMHQALKHGQLPHFIGYDQQSATHQLIAAALQNLHVSTFPTFFSTSPEVMRRLVSLQKGAAVLPYLLVKDLLDSGTCKLLGMPKPIVIGRSISIATRPNKLLPPALLQITAQLQACFESVIIS